jgi:dTDP-4-dehydrorhamnose 3,5-epimerase-like enzyme
MPEANDTGWRGINETARERLELRDYSSASPAEQLAAAGMDAGGVSALRKELASEGAWIPGVELFARAVYQQKGRGHFAEFAREHDGLLADLGLWPEQWATARMFSGTAKGFHIHPPHIPEGEEPEPWLRKLYIEEPENFGARPYDREQWDVMFFVQGMVDMVLVDERAGLERRIMRFTIFGDDMPGPNNVGVVIPPGVAHSLRCLSGTDGIMVYGTSTSFDPSAEGRIESGVEAPLLPKAWQRYLDQ